MSICSSLHRICFGAHFLPTSEHKLELLLLFRCRRETSLHLSLYEQNSLQVYIKTNAGREIQNKKEVKVIIKASKNKTSQNLPHVFYDILM
jgi:hypothetical protein